MKIFIFQHHWLLFYSMQYDFEPLFILPLPNLVACNIINIAEMQLNDLLKGQFNLSISKIKKIVKLNIHLLNLCYLCAYILKLHSYFFSCTSFSVQDGICCLLISYPDANGFDYGGTDKIFSSNSGTYNTGLRHVSSIA